MDLGRHQYILPNAATIYIGVLLLTSSHIVATLLTILPVALLYYFRLKPVSQTAADEALIPTTPSIIAHKCAACESPENTICGIVKAAENGATAIEFDVGYTSDSVAVLMHDERVDRTTNGLGELAKLPWKIVCTLNPAAKSKYRDQCIGETVPTLEKAVETCLERGLKIYFDVKANADQTAITILNLYKKHPELYRMGVVCSFYPNIIYKVRRADAAIVTAVTWRPHILSRKEMNGELRSSSPFKMAVLIAADRLLAWAHFTWLPLLVGNSALLIIKDCMSRQLLYHFQTVLGVQVVVWTVDDPREKAFIKDTLGCHVITNYIKNS